MEFSLLFMIGRELQRISGNSSSKVGHLSMEELKGVKASMQLQSEFHDLSIPLLEEALKVISSSVRQVILDAKVGPPLFEKRLANDILAIVEKTKCKNCLVWAKSDTLARDVLKLSSDIEVGYIIMKEPSTGTRSNLLRMRGASVVGVYHPLVNENLMKVLHGRRKRVFAWTVDDKESMERMLSENVEGVVTGDPSLFQQLMQETRTQCLLDGFSLSK